MSTFTFDATTVEPDAGRAGAIPKNWYTAVVASSEIKPGADDPVNCSRMNLGFKITEGDYKGAMVFHGLNIKNPSEKAMQISYAQLSSLMHAIDYLVIKKDTSELHNKPCRIRVKVTPAVMEDDGVTVKYEEKNEITSFKSVKDPSAVSVAETAKPAAAAKTAPPAPGATAAPAPGAAAGTQPWQAGAAGAQPWNNGAAAPAAATEDPAVAALKAQLEAANAANAAKAQADAAAAAAQAAAAAATPAVDPAIAALQAQLAAAQAAAAPAPAVDPAVAAAAAAAAQVAALQAQLAAATAAAGTAPAAAAGGAPGQTPPPWLAGGAAA